MARFISNAARISFLAMLLMLILPLVGCSKPTIVNGWTPVKIGTKTFQLEIVADDDTRTLGLGGRTELDADKGMLFSFPDARLRNFVMRDCFIDIDIIFLDANARIIAMHHMPIEEPKGDDETMYQYEIRLKKYSSRYNAKYAIELAGGMLEQLKLNEGDKINLDTETLESISR